MKLSSFCMFSSLHFTPSGCRLWGRQRCQAGSCELPKVQLRQGLFCASILLQKARHGCDEFRSWRLQWVRLLMCSQLLGWLRRELCSLPMMSDERSFQPPSTRLCSNLPVYVRVCVYAMHAVPYATVQSGIFGGSQNGGGRTSAPLRRSAGRHRMRLGILQLPRA